MRERERGSERKTNERKQEREREERERDTHIVGRADWMGS